MWRSTKTFDWYIEQRRSLAAGARRAITLVASNRKVAATVAVGVVGVLALIGGYFAWSGRQEANAAAVLFKAAIELTSKTGTAEDVPKQEEGLRLLREVITRYPATAAGAEAALRLGTHYYTLGNYDAARNVYEGYLAKNPRGRVAFGAGLGVGDTYLAQGKFDSAVETYSRLIEKFPREPLLAQAYLHLARAYHDMKREKDAARVYQKVVEAYQNTGWAQYAQTQLHKLIPR